MDVTENWSEIKALFKRSFRSSFHFAVASIDAQGEPHVTPIGSLVLGKPGHGVYFEAFTRQLPSNAAVKRQVCVLAVDSSKWFWLKSLFAGRFGAPPAVRLYGTLGELRAATPYEIELWQRRVRPLRATKGHAQLWAGMHQVREIRFTRFEPVNLGEITSGHWTGNR